MVTVWTKGTAASAAFVVDAAGKALIWWRDTEASTWWASDSGGACWWCGDKTRNLDVNFEAWLCPGYCTRAADRSFWVADYFASLRSCLYGDEW